MTKRVY